MKILIDSSTLYSAIAFPRKEQKMVKSLVEKYTIVSMGYIEEELRRNFSRTFSGSEKEDLLNALDIFMSKCETKKLEDFENYSGSWNFFN
ncbi:MAG: hypothetical protein KGY76_06530 [Candidatus Thermoplasmatota archaeon]|nr:hypothetical protein [Candidatus Thermoplasmatota archaeon]